MDKMIHINLKAMQGIMNRQTAIANQAWHELEFVGLDEPRVEFEVERWLRTLPAPRHVGQALGAAPSLPPSGGIT